MNRIELVALFTSLDLFAEKEDFTSIKKVIKTVLNESATKQDDDPKRKSDRE
ncbi:hypothetical protein FACS1894202_05520 [Clostridia bacterium]|nr:hypothetical protein FACS1894202_05520 [Clostridia bacterium]